MYSNDKLTKNLFSKLKRQKKRGRGGGNFDCHWKKNGIFERGKHCNRQPTDVAGRL